MAAFWSIYIGYVNIRVKGWSDSIFCTCRLNFKYSVNAIQSEFVFTILLSTVKCFFLLAKLRHCIILFSPVIFIFRLKEKRCCLCFGKGDKICFCL